MVLISRHNWHFPTIASCCQPYRVLDDEAAVLQVIVAEHIVIQPGFAIGIPQGLLRQPCEARQSGGGPPKSCNNE